MASKHVEILDIGILKQRLKKLLLSSYDKTQIPTTSNGFPVNVSLNMWPYDILYVVSISINIRTTKEIILKQRN